MTESSRDSVETERQQHPEAGSIATESKDHDALEHRSNTDETPSDAPRDRATIDKSDILKRPTRLFNQGSAVMMKETFVHYVVTDFEFNEQRNGWDYSLKEANGGLAHPGKVKETELKKRKT